MRISDWSSDVCSSDLESFEYRPGMARIGCDVGKPHREPRTVAELEMRGFRTYTLKGGDQIRIERELENMFGIGLPLQLGIDHLVGPASEVGGSLQDRKSTRLNSSH